MAELMDNPAESADLAETNPSLSQKNSRASIHNPAANREAFGPHASAIISVRGAASTRLANNSPAIEVTIDGGEPAESTEGIIMQRRNTIVAAALAVGVAASAHAQPLQIVDNLPGEFIDITQTGGTPLNLGDDEEVGIGTFAGNALFLAGTVVVGNNGGIGFGNATLTDLTPFNEPIPSGNAFDGGQAALAFWDDIDDKFGDVFFEVLADRLIVQWHDRPIASNPTGSGRFQIQVFDVVGPEGIAAQFLFDDIEQPGYDGGLSATIGYQDGGTGFGDVQWSFNTAGAVSNGTVLSLVVPEPGALALLAMGGPLAWHRRRLRGTPGYRSSVNADKCCS